MDSSRSSTITLDGLSFVVAKTNKLISGLSGKIENRNNQARLEQLTFHLWQKRFAAECHNRQFGVFPF